MPKLPYEGKDQEVNDKGFVATLSDTENDTFDEYVD